MPILQINFDATGGTNFVAGYRPSSNPSANFVEVGGIVASPAMITVPTSESYDYYIKKICQDGSASWVVNGTAVYQIPCAVPTLTLISRTGADFSFSRTIGATQPYFYIEVTDPNNLVTSILFEDSITSNPFTVSAGIAPLANLTNGLYRFRMKALCGNPVVNVPASNWTSYVDSTVTVSTCIAPSDIVEFVCTPGTIPYTDVLPNAIIGTAYSHDINISGTSPFTLVPIDIPSWMTISMFSANVARLTGTPTGSAATVSVKFNIVNCGSSSLTYNKPLTVAAPVLTQSISLSNALTATMAFNMLINGVNVSGLRSVPSSGSSGIFTASGGGVNSSSSTIDIVFATTVPPTTPTVRITQYSSLVPSYNSGTKTFTFTGVNTNIAQTLTITVNP